MSDANYYQPHVYIDGVKLAEHKNAGSLVAVADLRIKWGGDDWWENIDAAKLTMTLLDPHGELLTGLANQRIEIRRDPDDSIVFRGTIDDIKSQYGTTTDPRTGKQQDTWVHEITAVDPMAQLQRDRRTGPRYPTRDLQDATLHWGPCYMYERKNDISGRSPVPVVWEPTTLDEYDDVLPIMIFPVSPYERQQVVSLLTVLRNTARISHPLNRPTFFVSRNQIRFIAPPRNFSVGTKPVVTSGKIVLEADSEVILPGSQLIADGGITTGTDAREQVNRVEITMRTHRPNTFVVPSGADDRYMEKIENTHAVTVPGSGSDPQLTVQVESDHPTAFWYTTPMISAELKIFESIHYIYKAPKLSPLKYRFKKHDPAPAWAIPWLTPEPPLTTSDRLVIYHLVESITNWVPGQRPFSVVGGEIRYTHKQGWEVTLNPVPVARDEYTLPTLGAVTISTTLANVGDNALIADYQQINRL